MKRLLVGLLFLSLAACSRVSGVEITHAWASPTPGGVTSSAGYMIIVNHGAAEDRLVSASSPRAARMSLHTMNMDGGMMQMRSVDSFAIPAGGSLTLAPQGMHLMFEGVTQPFAEGETIPLHLHFEHAGDMEVRLPVRRSAS